MSMQAVSSARTRGSQPPKLSPTNGAVRRNACSLLRHLHEAEKKAMCVWNKDDDRPNLYRVSATWQGQQLESEYFSAYNSPINSFFVLVSCRVQTCVKNLSENSTGMHLGHLL